MSINKLVILALLCVTGLSIGYAQTGGSGRSEGLLPAKAYFPDRDSSSLERRLRLLKESEAGMGESHPQLNAVRRQIAELETELEAFHAIPNPFEKFNAEGIGPEQIVERMSDKELRILVVRLAVDVKDLRSRVAELEGRFLQRR